MKVTAYAGIDDIARVYIAQTDDGKTIEFIESVQPPLPLNKKWVIIVSTLFGCPVGCPICDAGNFYRGKLTKDQIFAQIDYTIKKRFSDNVVPVEKFKIQFARMGEPSFNSNVLDVLDELQLRYKAPGLIPCVSTIAPYGTDVFFDEMLKIKKRHYRDKFQLQFSIHTTDEKLRDRLIPVRKWGFAQIADYGARFFDTEGRKITLNFALEKNSPLDSDRLSRYFDPDRFLIKITPVNPTYRAAENGLTSLIDPCQSITGNEIVQNLKSTGYEVIVSIGELEENQIGSNCGQYVTQHLQDKRHFLDGYSYQLQEYL